MLSDVSCANEGKYAGFFHIPTVSEIYPRNGIASNLSLIDSSRFTFTAENDANQAQFKQMSRFTGTRYQFQSVSDRKLSVLDRTSDPYGFYVPGSNSDNILLYFYR